MNAMKQRGIALKNAALARSRKAVVAAVATGSALTASMSHAIDDAAITAAQEAGKASVELTTTGMIQIVAVVVAVGIVIGLLKRV